jgi:hypothetical protein
MYQQHANSTSQKIASLRRYFRSQRAHNSHADAVQPSPRRSGSGLSSLLGFSAGQGGTWDETQWSETRQDPDDD